MVISRYNDYHGTSDPETKVHLAGIPKGASEADIRAAVRDAAQEATDFSWLSRKPKKSDTVFIKPALNSGGPYPATTSPIAVAAMVELLKERGAGRVIVGDMSGVRDVQLTPSGLTGSSRKLMESCGITQSVQQAGGEIHFFEEAGWNAFYQDMPLQGPHWTNGLMMPNILKEVDHIVLMPRCSRHVLAGSSLGLKAAVGYWRTDTRWECHYDLSTFHEKIAEGNTVTTLRQKQRLVLTTADRILTTYGPDFGYSFQPATGLVIASKSVVAHDMAALAWLLENRFGLSAWLAWFLEKECSTPLWKRFWYAFEALVGAFFPSWVNRQFILTPVERLIPDELKLCGHPQPPPPDGKAKPKKWIRHIDDDRILSRAYDVFGGRPKVTLEAADKSVPRDLIDRLIQKVA